VLVLDRNSGLGVGHSQDQDQICMQSKNHHLDYLENCNITLHFSLVHYIYLLYFTLRHFLYLADAFHPPAGDVPMHASNLGLGKLYFQDLYLLNAIGILKKLL